MAIGGPARAATADLEREVSELKGKIAEARTQLAKTRTEQEQDRTAYGAYSQQFSGQQGKQRAENDSLRLELRRYRQRADSLGRQVQSLRARQNEFDLRQKTFANQLLAACDALQALCNKLPPGSVQAQQNALQFLRGELAGGAVETVEALERLWHIHLEVDQSAGALDVYAGPAPAEFLQGQTDFVRLGHCYLSAVDEKGAAGLWVPLQDSSGGRWERLEDPAAVQALRNAVNVRRGNAVPQIVQLPVRHPLVPDTISLEAGR
jgi:hypothetical protein